MPSKDTSGNQSTDESECPTCDRTFGTVRGMRIHHKQAHGESLAAKVTVECAWCGNELERYPSLVKGRERCFCDCSCQAEWRRVNRTGEDSFAWEGGTVTVECSWCSEEIERKPSHVETTEHQFCGYDCHAAWKRGCDELVAVDCEWCGAVLKRSPFRLSMSKRPFCDLACFGEWQSVHNVGKNNPNYGGGEWPYGAGWNFAKKELARERDGRKCKSCGRTEEEHIKLRGCKHEVHHIQKARHFDRPEERNHLDNLVTLCKTKECHARWEKMSPLRPQTDP